MSSKQVAPDGMTALEHGEHDGIEWAVVEAPMFGAVNGYVCIPDDHPWHGLDYSARELAGIEVHGGLTYADDSWIGFDTLHSGDVWPGSGDTFGTPSWDRHWTRADVVEEAKRLAAQVAAARTGLGDLADRDALGENVKAAVEQIVAHLVSRGVDRQLAISTIINQAEVASR